MPVARRRGELRVELRRHKPRMARELDHLDEVVLRQSRETKTGLGVTIAIRVVELVAMAMPLAHGLGAVDGARQGVGADEHFLGAEAHGAALAGAVVALLFALGGVLPFGDERDDGMRARSVELGGVRAFEAEYVASELDAGELHAEADAEVRNLVLARVAHGRDLALDAALAEPAGYEDGV